MTGDGPRLAVVGAGPAGLAGAVAAADGGVAVTVVDAGTAPGGQFYRQPAARLHARRPQALHHAWRSWVNLRARFEQHVAAGRIRLLTQHHVWFAEAAADGPRVHALVGPEQERSVSVDADALLVATGAYEKVLPFPGWVLPGVVTAGGAQAMLKGNLVLPGRTIVVAGTGPLLLPVAAALAAAGARVSALIESADPRGFGRHAAVLAGHPDKLAEAAGYAARLARHRIAVRHRHVVIAAHGAERVEAVTVAALDDDGRVRPGSERRIACDTLAISHGLLPHLELAQALGATIGDDLRVTVDAEQRTDAPAVWAAGEATGIGGAALALAEGEIAGRSVAARLRGREPDPAPWAEASRARTRLREFFAVLDAVYTPPATWTDLLTDETTVCRCEEVPASAVRAAAQEYGASDLRTVKLLTRAGMGWCQGRVCAPSVAAVAGCPLTAGRTPFARPVPLSVIADLNPDSDERGKDSDEQR
jgi:NADPH-dependent 2,4-dienoyl-CoA reductase/sulfur reductase-like enzyme